LARGASFLDPNWLMYNDGTDDLSEVRLAIVVSDV
jgi:hypothetical protein